MKTFLEIILIFLTGLMAASAVMNLLKKLFRKKDKDENLFI